MIDYAVGEFAAFGEHTTHWAWLFLLMRLPDEAVFICLLSRQHIVICFCLASRSASSVVVMKRLETWCPSPEGGFLTRGMSVLRAMSVLVSFSDSDADAKSGCTL
ncbi:hypothetical protein D3C85_1414310 [compost metagenome]